MAGLLPLKSSCGSANLPFLEPISPISLKNRRPPKSIQKLSTRRRRTARAQAGEGKQESIGAVGNAAVVAGLVANPVVAWSLYTLKTTGCGLPPGPAGALGALEGFSFLAVFGFIGWSVYTKLKTGSGLPSGPFGLLGAVEGLSYLSLVATVVVFGLQFLDSGSIPGPLPSDQCFG